MGGSKSPRKVSTLLPEQKELLQQILGGGSAALPQGLDAILRQLDPEAGREDFQTSVADPALREFQSQIIPSILQSQANLGAKGGSAIDRQLAQAGAGLERGLSEQFAGQQQQSQQAGIQNLMALLFGGTGQEAFALQDRGPSFGSQLLGGALGLGGTLGGAAIGRPKF